MAGRGLIVFVPFHLSTEAYQPPYFSAPQGFLRCDGELEEKL